MGYGVVKPTLGERSWRIFLLGALYIIFSGNLSLVELVQRTNVVSVPVLILLEIPVAGLDTTFYWWIFLSLLRTIQQLQLRKQMVKLTMYKRFLGTLVISGIISGIIIIVQLIVVTTLDQDNTWKSQWIWTAFWHVLYLVILVGIAVIWRPTANNTRYAYSEISMEGTDEITLQPLNLVSDTLVQQRPTRTTKKDDQEKEQKQPEKSVQEHTVAFSIDDDDDKEAQLATSKME